MTLTDEEIRLKANNMATLIQNVFNEKVEELKNSVDSYSSLEKNHIYMKDLYDKYLNENLKYTKKIKKINSDIYTNDRKTYYEDQNYDILTGWYNIYKFIYITLIFLFIIFIFLADSSSNFNRKIAYLIIIILYPFAINPMVLFIMKFYNYIQKYLPKNVYNTNTF